MSLLILATAAAVISGAAIGRHLFRREAAAADAAAQREQDALQNLWL